MLRVLALALALLFAQQMALGHSVEHLGPAEAKSTLCDLHSAMGAVLGVLDAAPAAPRFDEQASLRFPAAEAGERFLPAPSPLSRGPPAVSLK